MKILITTLALLVSTHAYAGKCELTVTRNACAGKEADSYKKCDEADSKIKMKKLSDNKCLETYEDMKKESDCIKKAITRCENGRLDITKSKVITASFDGKAIEADKDFCKTTPTRSDFDKCDKK